MKIWNKETCRLFKLKKNTNIALKNGDFFYLYGGRFGFLPNLDFSISSLALVIKKLFYKVLVSIFDNYRN